METIFFIADEASRLDELLRKNLPPYFGAEASVSNSKIRRLIIAGAVFSNGAQRRIPAYTIKKGCRIAVKIDREKFFYEKQNGDISFELSEKSILYEDDFLIIVDKPAFFLTEPTIAGKRDNMHDAVIAWLWKKNPSLRNKPYAGIMHRLDRTTSGVLLFTKQRSVNARIHELFESGGVQKTYRALAAKPFTPPEANFSVESRIGKLGGSGMWGEVGDGRGRFARTDFTVLGECARDGKKIVKDRSETPYWAHASNPHPSLFSRYADFRRRTLRRRKSGTAFSARVFAFVCASGKRRYAYGVRKAAERVLVGGRYEKTCMRVESDSGTKARA